MQGDEVGGQSVHGTAANSTNNTAAARVWLDSAFFSDGELQILKDIADQSAGALAVSGETHSSFLSVKGAYVPAKWDLYWTVRRACHSVLGAIAPPKRVNCVPGVESVAYKQPLVRTMQEAYGEAAFAYIPRSYMLPGQYWTWRAWTQTAASPADLPWVLKANEHRGRGVRVMRQAQAQKQALIGIGAAGAADDSQLDGAAAAAASDAAAAAAASSSQKKGYVLVQSYVRHQFLYDGRPSYLRLWVVVTGIRPLRAHLFRGGVLVFGDRVGASSSGGAVAGGGGAGKRRRQRRSGGGAEAAPGGGAAAAAAAADRRLLEAGGAGPEEGLEWAGGAGEGHGDAEPAGGARSLLQQGPQHPGGNATSHSAAGAAAAGAGKGKGPGGYEMHSVNYWTIAGEKMQPWTLARLRAHVEAELPGGWERTWAHARASVGMVLASATKRMRLSMRGLGALEGCGFEVLGVDFLLNSTFHPTLVELNALPSLARLRLAPGDPALLQQQRQQHQGNRTGSSSGAGSSGGAGSGGGAGRALLAGAGGGAGAGAGAASAEQSQEQEAKARQERERGEAAAAAVAAFDLEKERFLQHTLRLVGMPLGPPPGRGAATNAAAGASSGGGGGPATLGQVLRSFAALLRPPNNETRDLQVWLRTHYPPAVAAAADAIPQLAPLLCPVPASWGPAPGWPVLPAPSPAAAAAATAATGRRRSRQLLSADAVEAGGAEEPLELAAVDGVSPLQELLTRHVALGLPPLGLRRLQSQQVVQVQPWRQSAARPGRGGGAVGGDSIGIDPLDGGAPDDQLGAPHRNLQSAGAAGAGAGAGAGVAAAGLCKPRCYEWDMLAALGDAEFELEQGLDFDHIFPMAEAAQLNAAALSEAAALERAAGADGADGKEASGAAAATGGSGEGGEQGGELDISSARGGLFAQQSRLQKIRMGLGFVRESIGAGAVNLDLVKSIKYMTTKPYILASTRLPYARVDAILAAYEAVRARRGELCGAEAGPAGMARCAVVLLRAALDALCGDGGGKH
ncbi:hypothetical protein HXX76_009173 [Chlamydomonas incerta]|uniref:Tubulin--tyrosine ligase-like protein 5 n=1 Tax=Chlamydomonas incerta TaxID=51695 RepID=A0A835T4D7_CHLIN|nr:hypothetical protein HXX76_009173 [Chlamydomonas incerta]|eukprot:KAG2432255.1 hypothetical protein HXX76_009173 [Chlamydomonas incerta]